MVFNTENGLLSESENARGQQTAYEYDALGRVVKTTDELGTAEYFYDNNGNTLSVTEPPASSAVPMTV